MRTVARKATIHETQAVSREKGWAGVRLLLASLMLAFFTRQAVTTPATVQEAQDLADQAALVCEQDLSLAACVEVAIVGYEQLTAGDDVGRETLLSAVDVLDNITSVDDAAAGKDVRTVLERSARAQQAAEERSNFFAGALATLMGAAAFWSIGDLRRKQPREE